MARGRMISQSVSTDKRLNELSVEAELVFLLTIPHLDRDGLLLADAPILAGKVCPRREALRPLMESIIEEWIHLGLVLAYECEDGTILFFTGFAKNQAGMRYDREPKSTLPSPPGYTRTVDGLVQNEEPPSIPKIPPTNGSVPPSDGNLPTNVRQPADNLPSERARAEVEVEVEVEENRKESSPIPPLLPEPEPEAPAAQDNTLEIGAVFKAWLDNMPGNMTPILQDEILELIDECTARSVIHGITVSVEQNKRFFKYVASVARNHSAGREPPGRMVAVPKLSEGERSTLTTRAKLARSSLQTAQKFNGYIDPQWQQDIETAKGFGLI